MLEQFKKQMVSDVIRYGQMGFKFIESEHPRDESGKFSEGGNSGVDIVSADDTIKGESGVISEVSKKGEKMKEPHEKTRQEWEEETGIPAHNWRALEASGVAGNRRAAVTAAVMGPHLLLAEN